MFIFRYLTKAVVYYIVLLAAMAIGLLPGTAESMIPAALVLAIVNTFIRPLLVTIALPFNFITFGIASVFANLLTLVIANGIIGGGITSGFWAMLLVAFVIMLADDAIRHMRQKTTQKCENV